MMPQAGPNAAELLVALPMALPVLGAMLVLLLTVSGGAKAGPPQGGAHMVGVAWLSLAAAAWALTLGGPEPVAALGGSIVHDGLSQTLGLTLCLASALTLLLAMAYLTEHSLAVGEFCALVLLASAGALAVICSQDLLAMFLGIEVMSVAAYVLAGYRRALPRSQEAALKYFFYGAYAAAAMVFGMALIWGEVGLAQGAPSLLLPDLRAAVQGANGHAPLGALGWVGATLVLSTLCFKVAAAPFHMWAPDVYEGAPTPSAAFLSVAIKVAAMAALARLMAALFAPGGLDPETATQVIEILAIASMVVGNTLALRQVQIKRMLAYSSVAHAGYVLTGLTALPAGDPASTLAAVGLYLTGYTAAALGAFAVVIAFESQGDRRVDLRIDRLAGAARRSPGLAVAMAVCLLGLAGIPPTAGFTGKVALFGAALGAGRVAVVLVAALTSVVGAFYYLRVLGVMFMGEPNHDEALVHSPWLTWALWLCAGLTLGLGLLPNGYYGYALAALAGWTG